MNQSQWDNLNAFAAATNTSLVFGLRATSGGPANDTVRLAEYVNAHWPLLMNGLTATSY